MWHYDPNADDNDFTSGWAPSPPDPRDLAYTPSEQALADSRDAVDIAPSDWAVWSQGDLPSCTAMAIAGAMGLLLRTHQRADADHTHDWDPSPMFVYYNERAEIGAQSRRVPAHVRSAVKGVRKTGICPYDEWPYDVSKYAEKPPAAAYEAASPHKEVRYRSIDRNVDHLKACIKEGHPFTIGFRLFHSLNAHEIRSTGHIPAPTQAELTNLPKRGHCVLVTGFDDANERFLMRNSYGSDWGRSGYGTLPYAYVTTPKLCADLWTVRWEDENPIEFSS